MLLDAAAVLVFVGIGRSVHTHGDGVGGLASTAWPFLVGLGAGWLVVWRRRGTGASLAEGCVVVVVAVAVGMVLRVVAGQGTALAFVLVALAFLGLFMLGWRVAAAALERRSATRRAGPR